MAFAMKGGKGNKRSNGRNDSLIDEDGSPITGLCIVADPTKCPPGYDMIYRSYDKQEDCDLWKDGWFGARVTRYLCYCTAKKGVLAPTTVLSDIMIKTESEALPQGFSLIDHTVDTRDKATRKKQICIKMQPYDSGGIAVSQLLLLSGTKRAPVGYTLVGEINNLMLCFKSVKLSTTPTSSAVTPTGSTGTPTCVQSANHVAPTVANLTSETIAANTASGFANSSVNDGLTTLTRQRTIQREDSVVSTVTALSGVPVHLNPHLPLAHSSVNMAVPSLLIKSRSDIENEYSYPFRIEKTAST